MSENYFKHRILPHFLSVFGFLLILSIYFYPAFFEDKTLLQNDVLQGYGSGQESVEFREKTGEEALWTNSMFGGMPLYLINIKYSGEWASKIIYAFVNFIPTPADTVLLNFICFYILLSVLKVRPIIAFLGAFVYAFGTYNIISIEAGHIWKVRAISFMPLVFAGVALLFRRQYLVGLGLTALAVAFELGAQHYQITYYLFLLLSVFVISEFWYLLKEKQMTTFFKAVSLLLVAAILGLGTSIGRLWGVYEYGKYSIRGASELSSTTPSNNSGGLDRDYAFAWSQGITETLTLLVPNLYGGASNSELNKGSETYETLKRQGVPLNSIKQFTESAPTYWGDQPFTSGPVYTGIITLFLFVLGIFILKPREKYWALVAVIFSFMLAWGNNFELFNYFMFDYFPGYNKFRAVSMALTIALFCFPLIAAITLDRILEEQNKNVLIKPLYKAGSIIAGLLILILVFSGVPDYAAEVDENFRSQGLDWIIDSLRADRKSMLVKDSIRSLLFVGVIFSLIYLYIKRKLSQQYLLVGALLATILDLYTVDKRYLDNEGFSNETIDTYFQPTATDQLILADTSHYRVFNVQNPFNEARTSYFHNSIGGYHGAKMRRYQDLIERHLSKNNFQVLNMLNTKYIITGDAKRPVQENPGALGNAWFVERVKPVRSADEEIDSLTTFDPSSTAFIDTSKFELSKFKFDSSGTIRLTIYKPNYLKYESQNDKTGFAVFSEIYYPKGWNAYIDGKPSNIVRANYILRGLEIPPGKHIVEFKFNPPVYNLGNKIMWVSSFITTLIFVVGLGLVVKNNFKK